MWHTEHNSNVYESGELRIVLFQTQYDKRWLWMCRAIDINEFENLGMFSDPDEAKRAVIAAVRERLNGLIASLPEV